MTWIRVHPATSASASASWTSSSFIASKSKARLPRLPFTSSRITFFRPVANRVASKTPSIPPVEPGREDRGVVDRHLAGALVGGPAAGRQAPGRRRQQRTLLDEGLGHRAHAGDRSPGDELRGVDDVRADVAEGAGAGLVPLQPPHQRELRVDDPVLQVLRPHVAQLPQPAGGDDPLGERERRDPPVVEADHRPDAAGRGRLGGPGHLLGLLDGVRQRLLAQHVLARLERSDRDLGVAVARRADVHQVDVVAPDQRPPVGLDRGPAEAVGRRAGGVRGAPAQGGHVDPVREVEEAPGGAPRL